MVDLTPGAYTAVVTGVGGQTGVALAEVYDATNAASNAKLSNLSSRAFVGSDAQVLIPGLVIQGNSPRSIMIRAVGPTLANFGVSGTISNPQLSVIRSDGVAIASNDDWNSASNANAIRSFANAVGAFALPEGSADAAVLLDLPPGTYTVVVSGVSGATGVALVEAYPAQ